MHSLLLYPPHHNYKMKDINFYFDLKKMEYIGPFIDRNTKYWNELYEKIDNIFKDKKKLPKGTPLYRCSTQKDPLMISPFNDNSKVVYFGIDFVISVWLGLEINERSDKYIPCYLHVYELQKDIPYKYLYSLGSDGVPMELDPITCGKKACLHPQVILHGDEDMMHKGSELGVEISFPRNNFDKTIKNIKPLGTFEIDIQKLKENKEKYIFEFDPKKALIPKN